MDNFFLGAALVVLVFGIWICRSGSRRWRQRKEPKTDQITAETSPLTDFRWRPQFETTVGALMILWALRIFILFTLQEFSAKPASTRENPVTGRVETLPTSAAAVEKMTDAAKASTSTLHSSQQ